jgi:hypothetical protein
MVCKIGLSCENYYALRSSTVNNDERIHLQKNTDTDTKNHTLKKNLYKHFQMRRQTPGE